MTLPEKKYALRRKRGLSQQQLANELDVSRQAISKWESRQSIPESEMLIAISTFFGVSLDYLLKDDIVEVSPEPSMDSKPKKVRSRAASLLWLLNCILGAVCLVIWGLVSIFNPSATNNLSASSAIHIDGNGMFLIICVVAIAVGVVLLFRNANND